jgi:hypothetical protein
MLPQSILIGFVILVVTHLREQLGSWRQQLIPQYAEPHLLTAEIMFIVVVFGLPLFSFALPQWCTAHFGFPYRMDPDTNFERKFIASYINQSPVAPVAFGMTLATITAWLASLRSPLTAIGLIPVTVAILLNPTQQQQLQEFLTSQPIVIGGHTVHNVGPQLRSVDVATAISPASLCVGLFSLDAVALVLLRFKLGRLREPSAGDWQLDWAPSWRIRKLGRSQSVSQGFLARAWRRRVFVLGRWAPWIVAVCIVVILLTIYRGDAMFTFRPEFMQSLAAWMIVSTITPGISLALMWQQRWKSLGYESLQPRSRPDFVREIVTAMAIDLLEFWVALTLAVMLPLMIWRRDFVFSDRMEATLLASGCVQVPILAAVAWSVRYRAWSPLVLALVFTTYYGSLPIAAAFARGLPVEPIVLCLIAVGALLVGGAILFDAYQHWCRVELG